jgi:hypothetical protein
MYVYAVNPCNGIPTNLTCTKYSMGNVKGWNAGQVDVGHRCRYEVV